MANESIAFDVELKTAKAATGVQSLRTELKNLRNQLASLDEGSAEFSKIAAKAGAVQDKIGDLKDTIAAFHPERKFQAFTQGIQGVVGGFTAVQGAMALFGNESEDLQKTLVKVQGAMALSQGLNSLMGLGDAFKNLKLVAVSSFATIRTAAIATFTTIKGAMAATGIGALVVALGFLVAKFIETSAANKEATEKEKEYTEATKKAKEATEEKVASLNLEILAIKEKTSLAGASLITSKAELEFLKEQLDSAEKHNAALKDEGEFIEINGKRTYINLKIETDATKEKIKTKELEVANLEKIAAKTKELENAKKAADDAEKKRQKEKDIAEKKKKDAADFEKMVIDEVAKKKEDDIEIEKDKTKKKDKDVLAGIKEHNEKVNAALKDRDKKRIEDLKVAEKTKVEINLQAANALAGIGTLINQLAGESKELMAAGIIAENAAGIAKIIISTNASNAAMQTSPANIASAGIFGLSYATANWISAGIAIASSVAATTKALSALGSGGSAGGGGNTSAPPPMTRPQSSRVSLDSGGKPISVSDKTKQKVYVVERDITNTQSRVSVIQNRARFG